LVDGLCEYQNVRCNDKNFAPLIYSYLIRIWWIKRSADSSCVLFQMKLVIFVIIGSVMLCELQLDYF